MTRDVPTHRAFGVVLDPVQFAAELASLKQRPKYRGRALYVSLPNAVAKLFESSFVPLCHSLAISGVDSLPVAVLTLQAAGTQVVCVVPLATDGARDWLVESVEGQRCIYVAVTIAECKQLVLVQAQPPVRDLNGQDWLRVKEKLGAWRSTDRAAEAADVLEVLQFVEQDSASEVPGFDVQDRWIFVCVSHPEAAAGAGSSEASGDAAAAVH